MGTVPSVRIEGDTIIEAFRHNLEQIPDRPAMRRRTAHGWETLTWADYGTAVREVMAGLAELGIGPGQQVGIFSNNRVEWHLADIGALANGSVTVPLYQTSSSEQVAYILGHAEARRVLRRGPRPAASRSSRSGTSCPSSTGSSSSKTMLASMTPSSSTSRSCAPSAQPVCSASPACSTPAWPRSTPSQAATLVYTSGTTGPPKGTIISHANIMWTIRSSASMVQIRRGRTPPVLPAVEPHRRADDQ